MPAPSPSTDARTLQEEEHVPEDGVLAAPRVQNDARLGVRQAADRHARHAWPLAPLAPLLCRVCKGEKRRMAGSQALGALQPGQAQTLPLLTSAPLLCSPLLNSAPTHP